MTDDNDSTPEMPDRHEGEPLADYVKRVEAHFTGDPFLHDLANLKPGDPIPTPSVEAQVDSLENDQLLKELVDLHLRIDPNYGPPLTPEDHTRRNQLWRWFQDRPGKP